MLNKAFLNAFDTTTHPYLPQTLSRHGLEPHAGGRLVFMGQKSNQCVRLTAVGGSDKPGNPHKDGATQFGYVVMSCQQVLRGGPATRRGAPGVVLYNHL